MDSVQSFSLLDTALALVISLVLGLFVFFVYKKTFHGELYSSTFGVSLIGMVGALSIVRFRAAIKDPFDIVYLFWTLACRTADKLDAMNDADFAAQWFHFTDE